MANPAAQAHCRCQSPHGSTAVNETGAVQRRDVLTASIACLTIVVSSATNLEIEMSKPRPLLIHCSNGIRQGAKHGQRGRSFRPLVIHGGRTSEIRAERELMGSSV
jgi:hypothetical protein